MDYRDEIKTNIKEAQWTFWKVFWPVLIIVMVISALSWGVAILTRPAQIIERVTEPDRIIQNYEWFENTYNDALAIDRQIKTAKQAISDFEGSVGERANWKRTTTTEHGRLNSILQGLRNQRDNIISDYKTIPNPMLTRQTTFLAAGQNSLTTDLNN